MSEKRPEYTRVAIDEKRFLAQDAAPLGPPPAPSKRLVVASLSFYLVAALVMVMVNKWVLNQVQVPLFFLLVQLVIAVILLQLCSAAGFFHLPPFQLSTCKGLAPLIALNCIGLAFNTYCLQFVDASFYQVARGLVLPFTFLLSHLMLPSRMSLMTLGGVALVCAGFVCGVSGERLTVSHLGVALGVFSSATTAIHAIVVKNSVGVVSNTLELVYLNNLLSAIVMLPMMVIAGETPVVVQMIADGGEDLNAFMTGALVTGVFGFLICVASFISIKVTSPVSHMVSSAVRGVIQTYLGVWIFDDIVSSGRAAGIAFILGGSALYTWAKARETSTPAPHKTDVSSASTPMPSPPPAYRPPSRVNTSPQPSPVATRRPSLAHNTLSLPKDVEAEGDERKVY